MLSSPLRYPGGKAKIFSRFVRIMSDRALFGLDYYEPYCGGAGLALRLLESGFVANIYINDADIAIYAFWISVTRYPDLFCEKIFSTEISIEEWHRQKKIWLSKDLTDILGLGFATYYLNRTNRSGIICGGGPVGGFKQEGSWSLDARYNKLNQIKNIELLSCQSSRINVSNLDARIFLDIHIKKQMLYFILILHILSKEKSCTQIIINQSITLVCQHFSDQISTKNG